MSQITPNVQNINIVQHNINIIQNGPNATTFTNIGFLNESKNQEATPLKTGKNTLSESITKKKKGDRQTKLQTTPNKKGAKTQKSQKTENKKKEKNQSMLIKEIIIQDNEKPIEKGGYWGTDGLLKKRGRKKKDEVNEEVIDVIESSSFENKENHKSQQENSEFKRETRSKKIKY